MQKTKKFVALLLCLIMILGVLAGCSSTESSSDTAAVDSSITTESKVSSTSADGEEKVLRIMQTVDPNTLDPQLANSSAAQNILSHTYEPLVRSYQGKEVEGAAESYDVSEDGLTYTFHLREFYWSDGVQVTAADYEYGMKRLMDPATAAPYSFYGAAIKNGTAVNSGEMDVSELGVNATDELTLIIELEYPAPYFVGMLMAVNLTGIREDIVEQYGTEFALTADKAVYNGPFLIESFTENDRVVLTKNEDWYNAAEVNMTGVEILTLETTTGLSMYEAGDLDYTVIPSTQYAAYADVAETYYIGAVDYIMLNEEKELMANENLRLALCYGIDRQEYIDLANGGLGTPAERLVLPTVNGVSSTYGEEFPLSVFPSTVDLEQAQKYLAAALEDLGLSDPSEITLELTTADAESSRTQAEVIQAQYQENLGINITIKQVTYNQWLEAMYNLDYEILVTGWMPDYSDPYTYLEQWISYSDYNNIAYNNSEYDSLLEQANQETDPEARLDLMCQAEQILLEEGALVVLRLREDPVLIADNLTGLNFYFTGTFTEFVYADFE